MKQGEEKMFPLPLSATKFTTRSAVASVLLLGWMSSILATADAAFVHRGDNNNNKSHRQGGRNSIHTTSGVAFVPTSKIRDLAVTGFTSPVTPTRLFMDDDDADDNDYDDYDDYDDDDDDDMMDMSSDYDDEDYDELVIDVEGDGDYGYDSGDDYDDDEDDMLETDPYMGLASSEFGDIGEGSSSSSSALATTTGSGSREALTTDLDWGGALGSLRSRMEDIESGTSGEPSQALFRMMSAPSPNQIIGEFVSSANPQVVQAMSGAVNSLLGGLASPNMGVDIQVKASGEKMGSLCFQLQMTGYMFRNAEYVLALKELMQLRGKKLTLKDYKEAFNRVDTNNSGYIETSEVQDLFKEAYGGDAESIPSFEVRAFLEFFDTNKDGRVSWEEFEQGLSSATKQKEAMSPKDELADRLLASMESAGGNVADDDEDENNASNDISEAVSGTIEIEMENGKVFEIDAEEYMENLKEEARKLKLALRQEKAGPSASNNNNNENDPMAGFFPNNAGSAGDVVDIAGYIASRQGDVRSLTEGITPEVVETMKKLVEFVLDGGESGLGRNNLSKEEKAAREMEIPAAALQQLALWQLVLGYKMREEEAKGDYVNLLKS